MVNHYDLVRDAIGYVASHLDLSYHDFVRLEDWDGRNVLVSKDTGGEIVTNLGVFKSLLVIIDAPEPIDRDMASTVTLLLVTREGKTGVAATDRAAFLIVQELEVLRVQSATVPESVYRGDPAFSPHSQSPDLAKLDIMLNGSRIVLRGDFALLGFDRGMDWFAREMVRDD